MANTYTFNSTNKITLKSLYDKLYVNIWSQNLANNLNKAKNLDKLENSYIIDFDDITLPRLTDINFAEVPVDATIKEIKGELKKLKKSKLYLSKILYKAAKNYFDILEDLKKNNVKLARN